MSIGSEMNLTATVIFQLVVFQSWGGGEGKKFGLISKFLIVLFKRHHIVVIIYTMAV